MNWLNSIQIPRLFLIAVVLSLATFGCGGKPSTPPPSTSALPRHWDVGDAVVNHALPPEISDGFLEFARSAGMSFGVTMAHDRVSQRRHNHSDLLIYVHSGVARIHAGDKEYTSPTGDVVFVPRGTTYWADAASRRQLELLSIFAPPLDPDDVEYLEAAERVTPDSAKPRIKILPGARLAMDSLKNDTADLEKEIIKIQDYREVEEKGK